MYILQALSHWHRSEQMDTLYAVTYNLVQVTIKLLIKLLLCLNE